MHKDAKEGSGEKNDKPSSKEKEDFYFEGAFVVFTEMYHLKRGSCCKSGCRHCPYGFKIKG
jgi:hypothetical protein